MPDNAVYETRLETKGEDERQNGGGIKVLQDQKSSIRLNMELSCWHTVMRGSIAHRLTLRA